MILTNEHIHFVNGQTPVIRDTGISVAAILKLLQDGHTLEAILAQNPTLLREDIQAAIGFASDAMLRYIETLPDAVAADDENEDDEYEDSDEQIREGIKQGWREAMRGEGKPIEVLWSELDAE